MIIVVDPEVLDELVNLVAQVDTSVSERVQSLSTRVASVATTWEGQSAVTYQNLYDRWLQGMTTMRAGLESMRAAAVVAATNHRSATDANVRMWR